MNRVSDTEAVIRGLAAEIAARGGGGGGAFHGKLLLAAVVSLAAAAAMAVTLFDTGGFDAGAAPAVIPWSMPFQQKVSCTLVLAAGAFHLVRDMARPEAGRRALAALLPGVALFGLGGAMDVSGLAVAGRSGLSVPLCVGSIILLSVPALAMVLGVLRTGAPARPAGAGAAAGVLAGALGATAYALVCRNDGGLFVALWYGTAILVTAALGAVAGRRVLAW